MWVDHIEETASELSATSSTSAKLVVIFRQSRKIFRKKPTLDLRGQIFLVKFDQKDLVSTFVEENIIHSKGMWVVILIIVVIIVVVRALTVSDCIATEVKQLDIKTLRTGDLLAVSLHGIKHIPSQIISGCKWVHAALVYRKRNKLYVLEGTYPGRTRPYSFYRIPLEKWLYYNRHHDIAIMKLHGPVESEKLYKSFEPFIKLSTVEPLTDRWIRFAYTSDYFKYEDHHYDEAFTCVEACLRTLMDCGVYQNIYQENSYLLEAVLRREVPCNEGFYFDAPQRFTISHH
jgi:hypothetical protein